MPTIRAPSTIEDILQAIKVQLTGTYGGTVVNAQRIGGVGSLTEQITTFGNHLLKAGMYVNIVGIVGPAVAGLFRVVLVVDALNFQVTLPVSDGTAWVSGGNVTLWTTSTFFIATDPEFVPTQIPSDVVLAVGPGSFSAAQGLVDGGGTEGQSNGVSVSTIFEVEGQLPITLWRRLQTDMTGHDEDLIGGSVYTPVAGVQPSITQLFHANVLYPLQLLDPINGFGEGILSQPMRLLQWEVPKKTQKAGWAVLNSTWEVFYQQAIP